MASARLDATGALVCHIAIGREQHAASRGRDNKLASLSSGSLDCCFPLAWASLESQANSRVASRERTYANFCSDSSELFGFSAFFWRRNKRVRSPNKCLPRLFELISSQTNKMAKHLATGGKQFDNSAATSLSSLVQS